MPTPHDALFKHTFGQPEHAASMLRSALPPALAQRIDWSTLQTLPISFVDEELLERYADLLFSAQLGERPALIYFLYEHQSSPDAFMPLRLLDYCVRAWVDWRRKHPDAKRLPAIVPVVLHHSKSGWAASTHFADLVDLGEDDKQALGPHLIDFRFLLDDLTHQSDADLHARALTQMAELVASAFKHLPYAADPLPVLEALAPLMLSVMAAPNGMAALSAVLRYALQVSEVEVDQLKSLVGRRLGKPAEEAVMTTAEKLEQQGMAKGRVEGEAKGRVEGEAKGRAATLLKLLALKFGPLAPEITDRVRSASIDELDLWAERILSAITLDEVLR